MLLETLKLGINIDHIAVLREARKINDPDPLMALALCAQNGADQITLHLREDRRHIQDDDVRRIIESSPIPVNLECSLNGEIIDRVCALRPHRATIVPEKREEVTTEGGLNLSDNFDALLAVIKRLKAEEIEVSLFIDPTQESVNLASELGTHWVELHTGSYANIYAMRYSSLPYGHHTIDALRHLTRKELDSYLTSAYDAIVDAANRARMLGLKVAAGHGLNYQNTSAIVAIDTIQELNIGQSVIARSIFTGLAQAVNEMKRLCQR